MATKLFTLKENGTYHFRCEGTSIKLYGGTSQILPYTFHDDLTVLGDLIVGDTRNQKIECVGEIIAYTSDERLKTNIVDISDPIDKIKNLRGVYFNWNEKSVEVGFNTKIPKDREIGMTAQELEKVIPDAVYPAPFRSNKVEHNNKYKTIKMEKVIPLLIECIKDQQKQIDDLRSKI